MNSKQGTRYQFLNKSNYNYRYKKICIKTTNEYYIKKEIIQTEASLEIIQVFK